MEEKRNAYWDFVGKPEGKRLRRMWNDNIKIVLSDIEWGAMKWIRLSMGT
jgi:hypothetical protein